MELLDKIGITYKKVQQPEVVKAIEPAKQQPPYRVNQSIMSFITSIDKFDRTFRGLAATCTSMLQNMVSGLEWKCYKETAKGDIELDPMHWLSRIFNQPNINTTKSRFLRDIVALRVGEGNAWYSTTIGSGNIPLAMHQIPARTVQPVYSNNIIAGYEFWIGNYKSYFPVEEVLHIAAYQPTFDINKQFLGLSLIDQILDDIITDDEMRGFVRRIFKNDGMPPQYLKSDMEPEQWESFKSSWNQSFKDHKLVAQLDPESTIERLGEGIKDYQSLIPAMDEITEKKICTAFGIPPGFITGKNANRATAEVDEYKVSKYTIEPLAITIEEQLTNYFSQFEPGVKIKHTPAVFEDRELRIKEEEFFIRNMIKTPNEVAKDRGFEPKNPDGDKYYIQSGLLPVEVAISQSQEPKPTPEPAKPETPVNMPEDMPEDMPPVDEPAKSNDAIVTKSEVVNKEYYKLWKSWNDINRSYEKKLVVDLKKFLNDLSAEIISNLKNNKLIDNYITKGEQSGSFDLFDIEAWKKKLEKYTDKNTSEFVVKILKRSIERLGLEWDNVASDFDKEIDRLVKQGANNGSVSVETINDALQNKLQRLFEDSQGTGDASELLQRGVKEYFSAISNSRPVLIARTQATFITGVSQNTAWKPYKDKINKIWVSQRDGRVRATHLAADGQKADKEGYFTVGGYKCQHPAGTGVADEDVMCRCYQDVEVIGEI